MKGLVFSMLAVWFCFPLGGCVSSLASSGTASAVMVNEGQTAIPTTAGAAPSKKGEACLVNVLGLVSVGDASISRAMQAGGISRVVTIDYDITGINLWWLRFGESCLVVRGE